MRAKREGEVVCSCKAYAFPHRQFGGRCSLIRWVNRFYEPTKRECVECGNYDRGCCQVVEDLETPNQCPALRAFIRFEGIKLYAAAAAAFERRMG